MTAPNKNGDGLGPGNGTGRDEESHRHRCDHGRKEVPLRVCALYVLHTNQRQGSYQKYAETGPEVAARN